MKKKLLTIIISVIVLLIILGAYIFSKSSCGYRINYDPDSNICKVILDQCTGEIVGNVCIGPVLRIGCDESQRVCGKKIKCNCSENDNTDWRQVYGKQIH